MCHRVLNDPDSDDTSLLQGAKLFAQALCLRLFLLLTCTTASADSLTDLSPGKALLIPATRIAHDAISECSGLAYTGDAFWTHNDSGDGPRLFRSETIDFMNAQVFTVPEAEARDWEELAVLDGDILVCDTGDNGRNREHVTVYRVRYDRATKTIARIATYTIKYPDGPHDCEGVCAIAGKLHLFVKNRGEPTTDVFRCDDLTTNAMNTAVVAGQLDLPPGEQITAADIVSNTVTLLSYTHVYQYPKDRLSGPAMKSTLWAARQSEALCYKGGDLFIANEQRDVYEVTDFLARDYDSMLPSLAHTKLKVIDELAPPGSYGTTWTGLGTEVPLQYMLKDEYVYWLIAGDALHLRVRMRSEQEFRPTNGNNLGTGVLLMFGKERHLSLTTNDVQLFIGQSGDSGIVCWQRDATRPDAPLTQLTASHVSGGVKDSFLEFEASLPLKSLLGDTLPDTFLFNLFGLGMHSRDEALFSGQNFSVLTAAPYLWGDVTIEK